MIRQPKLRIRVVGRAAIGLLGVAAALLMAPIVTASPESDANDAITAAWQANGGDAGPLGPRSGDVYPAGAGFAQNFASGKMFFTPDTGAHSMQGAILAKYESLGGPAESDLGFPTIDEGPGRAPGSRNSTFSASDKPVIFWTAETGARVVRGAINAAWDQLGGSTGVLGVPAEDATYNGAVVSQKFTNGELSYDSQTKTFTTVPPDLAGQLTNLAVPDDPMAAIDAARRAAGGPLGPLGAAQGEPYPIGVDGFGQDFVNGKIFYSPNTGANVVTGQVLAKYESVGGPEGDLGFPITSEVDGGVAPASRMSSFAARDKPVIFWTPDHGAVIVRGPMNAAWQKLGGATGEIGVPKSDQTQNGDVITQSFSGGSISWNTETKRFSTEPAHLASQLSDLQVPESEVPPPPAASGDNGKWFRWTWWWLLAIVPVLLLVGLVAVAAMRNRRRDDGEPFGFDAGDRYGDGSRLDPGVVTGDHRDESGGEDALFGDRYAREGLGSLTQAGQPSSAPEEFSSGPLSFWGSPVQAESAHESEDAFRELAVDQEDPDAVDTAPTRIPTAAEVASQDDQVPTDEDEPSELLDREPVADTGRHARIDVDEDLPAAPAVHLPLGDPNEVPDGYPIKADTRSGLYWTPDSVDYDEAPAEIWFASEEMARTNGFVQGE
ncbi:MAG: LGFP repeat-containing protein [Mycolicibacterium sp.]|uniref:LGFP repeat-containing protein n=1 Tax=Mycolicibacterium sp. TaxID=2320850 RepID=UPI003D0BF790